MAKSPSLSIAAPLSPELSLRLSIDKARVLRGKGNGRSAAETQLLIDTLTALLPAEVKAAVTKP